MSHRFILYRILGNDLPPRHGRRQTLENLRFILDHEPDFPDTEKRWVINRVADREREAELIALVAERGHAVVVIPFDLREYARCFLDASGLPESLNAIETLAGKPAPNGGRSIEWIHRWKTLYAINVNGARNAAIADGIAAGAEWILPWDGGCFLTQDGFAGIVRAASAASDPRYVIVPMQRLSDNAAVLGRDYRPPRPLDEPQIAIRRDAADWFDESLRYGHRPKAELLTILGVPGPWHTWNTSAWEPRGRKSAVDAGRFTAGGWVARLGAHAADSVEAGDSQRWVARFAGISGHAAALDRAVVESCDGGPRLGCYDAVDRCDRTTVARIAQLADGFLGRVPPSVTDRPPIKGVGPNDYVSIGRYLKPTSTGAMVKDGDINLAAIRGRAEADTFDRYRMQDMIEAVVTLAVAHRLTGNPDYGAKAIAFVDRWFLDAATRMTPHGLFAQIAPGYPERFNDRGTLDFRDFWPLLDGLAWLRRAGLIDDGRQAELRSWFLAFQDHLVKRASAAGNRVNNVGALYDVVAASVAAYLGDAAALAPLLARSSLRVSQQVSPWGRLPAETKRALPLHYSLFAIQALISLATIGRANGVDLWAFAGADHRSIPMAIRFVASNRSMFADYAERAAQFDDRILLAARQVPEDAADFAAVADLRDGTVHAPESLGTDDGLPPMWAMLYASDGLTSAAAA